MSCRRRCSTLFPYTTLFRSRHFALVRRILRHQFSVVGREVVEVVAVGRPARHDQDRKSTRLNSSHVKISYAVFCLKKKPCTTPSQHASAACAPCRCPWLFCC